MAFWYSSPHPPPRVSAGNNSPQSSVDIPAPSQQHPSINSALISTDPYQQLKQITKEARVALFLEEAYLRKQNPVVALWARIWPFSKLNRLTREFKQKRKQLLHLRKERQLHTPSGEALASERKRLAIPKAGLPLHPVSRLRDMLYGYTYNPAYYKGWKIAFPQREQTHISSSYSSDYSSETIKQGTDELREKRITNQLFNAEGKRLPPGWYMYVITTNNKFRYLATLAKNKNERQEYIQFRCHSQLAGGEKVYGAGTFYINEANVLIKVTTASGHYRPPAHYLTYTKRFLELMGLDVSKIEFAANILERQEGSISEKIQHCAQVGWKLAHAAVVRGCTSFFSKESLLEQRLARIEKRPQEHLLPGPPNRRLPY